jgi:type IV secretory pathway component VirB8
VPSPGGLPAPAFFDEADTINQEIIHRRNRERIDWLATMALAFVAGALITVTIQLFYR